MDVIRMACPHLGIVGRRITFSPARTLAHEQYNQPHEYYATDDKKFHARMVITERGNARNFFHKGKDVSPKPLVAETGLTRQSFSVLWLIVREQRLWGRLDALE